MCQIIINNKVNYKTHNNYNLLNIYEIFKVYNKIMY